MVGIPGIIRLLNLQFQVISMESPSGTIPSVAVGQSGKIVRSTNNGSNWNNANSGLPASSLYNLNGVTFGNNTFLAVGQSGKIVRSTDNGTSFDNSTSGTSRYLNGVTFGNNTFVAVGQSGKIVRSTDNGSTWNNSNFWNFKPSQRSHLREQYLRGSWVFRSDP